MQMQKYRLIIVASLLLMSAQLNAQWLRAHNGYVVNDNNEKVILRGMGLGGWMLQEGYMYHLHFLGQQYRIREKIEEIAGPEKTASFYEKWLQNHCTRPDVDSLAAWGFNSIRLPMHYNLYTLPVDEEPVAGEHTWIEKGFALTDSLLAWCKENKMYLILDLHAAPGGQGHDLAISDRDPSKPSTWDSRANQEKTIALWRKLAERYANEPWIGGYDIINEPNWGFEDKEDKRGTAENKNEPLRKLLIEITTAIREVDQQHIIIIEGNGFGNNYRGVLPPWDDNLVLSFHKYGNFNNKASIQQFLNLREQYNIPLWLGESGENSNTWFTEAISLVENEGIGWAWWQMKKMGINNPLEIVQPAGYEKLLAYWSGKGPRPDADSAWKILEQLLDNLKIENNRFHPDVVDAMIRQVQSEHTIPFRNYVLKGKLSIPAVDFDMGRQRFAYYDRDSARYQYTPGVNTIGNKGYTYRNDGVDIKMGKDGPVIFSTEDGEWYSYTIEVEQAGTYNISAMLAADSTGSQISFNDLAPVTVPIKQDNQTRTLLPLGKTSLKKGRFQFKMNVVKGGFELDTIHFEKIN